MKKNTLILIVIIIIGLIIVIKYNGNKNNNFIANTNSYVSNDNQSQNSIWKIGETLTIGDIKSSPTGNYKYVVTNIGLEYYEEPMEKYKQYQGMYPSIIGNNQPSKNVSVTLLNKDNTSGFNVIQVNTTLFVPFSVSYGKFKGDNNIYIISNLSTDGGYLIYDKKGNYYGNTNTKNNNPKIFNNNNLSLSVDNYKGELSYIKITNNGTFGYDINNNLVFIN
jgi:hypothetical protein